jgi:7,8-dihydropterin-6-yl-methyl-4-(beta-D-ribofuranosyl)aminobenzene 5'-phosphate synthase
MGLMPLTITTLIENSPGEHHGLKTEHGLCFHIATGSHQILFDTGQSGAIAHNAAKLRIDLAGLDQVVLSHGHYDHSGGLRALTDITRRFTLTLGQGFFAEKYGDRGNAREYLGNDFDEAFLAARGVSWEYLAGGLREIAPGVHAVSSFPRTHADEKINPRFKIKTPDGYQDDPFDDEVLLALDSSKGLVVVLGCSHPGVKNLLDAVRKRLNKPIYAILGGTHLVEATPDSLEKTLAYLLAQNIQVIGVSHCTGNPAMDRLKACDGRFFHNRTGSTLFVE